MSSATKCELSVCVCVCVCVYYIDPIRCFLLHKVVAPHYIHSMSVTLAPYARAKGCTCAHCWPQLPTADHSGVSEWCTHSTLSATTNNQQGIIVYLSINNTTTIGTSYLWATTYAPYPTHIKVCNLCSVKTTEKKGVYYWIIQYCSTKAHFH